MAEITTIDRIHQFCELYLHNKPKYLKFALMITRDRTVVEDIVNDSFVTLWENRNNIPDIDKIEAYFCTVVKNNCLNWLRNKQTRMKIQHDIHDVSLRLLQYDLSALSDFDPNLIFTDEIFAILKEQLEKMPELSRKIFEENRFNGKTYQEIADEYNISVRMVTREIQSALSILRVSLKDYLPAVAAVILTILSEE